MLQMGVRKFGIDLQNPFDQLLRGRAFAQIRERKRFVEQIASTCGTGASASAWSSTGNALCRGLTKIAQGESEVGQCSEVITVELQRVPIACGCRIEAAQKGAERFLKRC